MKWKATRRPLHCYQNTPRSMRCFAAGGVYGGCRSVEALERKGSSDHCFRSGPYHETDVGKWHDCRYYLPAAKNSGQQTAFPAVRLSDHGETPEKEYNYTAVDIRIKENL